MTVSAIVPMTSSYGHQQVALFVLLAVPRPTPYPIFPNPFASRSILINFSYKNCWSAASVRATYWREVPC